MTRRQVSTEDSKRNSKASQN